MSDTVILLAALAPLSWVRGALVCRGGHDYLQQHARRVTLSAGIGALVAAFAAMLELLLLGPGTLSAPGLLGYALSIRLDALSVAMLLLVSFVGLVIIRFSHGYLAGDPRQADFLRYLCETLAAVSLLVLAGNVILLLAAWVATSLSFHRLLTFHRERAAAQTAAKKKFFVARSSDMLLGLAVLLMSVNAESTEIATISEAAQSSSGDYLIPALLLAGAAVLKSAQVPTHGWLVEVIAAPTPVSALLHAGIVNAGGFLIIRFADLMSANPPAMYLLLVIGGVSALYGSLVMLTQRSIKSALANSTIAQMGFMMLQCGFGAFSSALLHIIAHSLYKAHAFLASGSVVDAVRSGHVKAPRGVKNPWPVVFALLSSVALLVGWALLAVAMMDTRPAVLGLSAVLAMGVIHLLLFTSHGERSVRLVFRATLSCVAVCSVYLILQAGAAFLFGSAAPMAGALDAVQMVLMVLLLLSFGAIVVLQWLLPSLADRPRWQGFWVHLSNGLYIDQLFDQFTGVQPRMSPAPVRD